MACYKLMYSGSIVFVFTAVFFAWWIYVGNIQEENRSSRHFVALYVTSASAFKTTHKLHTYKKNYFITIYVYHWTRSVFFDGNTQKTRQNTRFKNDKRIQRKFWQKQMNRCCCDNRNRIVFKISNSNLDNGVFAIEQTKLWRFWWALNVTTPTDNLLKEAKIHLNRITNNESCYD